MIKRLLLIAGFFLIVFGTWNYELVTYGFSQARGQLKVLANAKPIGDFLNDPEFPDSLKQKLRLIQDIRQFAIDSLSIADSKNYRTLFDQKGKDILWVLTASPQFSLEPKTWKFPLLGSFSYKGYFDLERAQTEKEALIIDGWDTSIRSVTAWSTLGWFSDPILSKMLDRDRGQLANLIIHELTHATLFVKDSVIFNENLASFIGDKGAQNFLILKYGENSAEYLRYLRSMSDKRKYTEHFLRGAGRLDSLYQTFDQTMDIKQKQVKKDQMIRSVVGNLDTIFFHFPKKHQALTLNNLPNNTCFQSFLRYQSMLPQLEEEYKNKFHSNLAEYLDYLKKTYPSL